MTRKKYKTWNVLLTTALVAIFAYASDNMASTHFHYEAQKTHLLCGFKNLDVGETLELDKETVVCPDPKDWMDFESSDYGFGHGYRMSCISWGICGK